MTYRDTFEKCPRCGVELVDARSARACRACGGLWVEEQVVTEMVLAMLPPRPLGKLVLAVLQRSGSPIGCPTCGVALQPTSIHHVELDRCPKHGIWFDAEELQTALHRVADPSRPPPLATAGPPPSAPLPRPRPPTPPPPASTYGVELVFRVEQAGRPATEVRVATEIIKIGRLASAHVRIADDEQVSRLHAVIEVQLGPMVTLIDLGSTAGTRVNGTKVNKTQLHPGDRIQVGATVLTVTFGPA